VYTLARLKIFQSLQKALAMEHPDVEAIDLKIQEVLIQVVPHTEVLRTNTV